MNISNRRAFLRRFILLAGLTGSQSFPPFLTRLRAQTPRPGNALRIPPEWDGSPLKVAPGQLEVWPGYLTDVFSVNGSVPGPTIRIQKGEEFSAKVENHLSEEFVMHWHGILAPESMDGHPRDAVAPGEFYEVNFRINQPASTSWYHSHTDMLTAEQVYAGVAGLFIVEDPSESALGLPTADNDIPLIIADRRSNAQRQFNYSPFMRDIMTGYLGDIALVNGTPDAWLSVDSGLYRFRLLNGSNARVFRIALSNNQPFQIIGSDSGLLAEPIEVTSAWVAPGERTEILIDFSTYNLGDSVVLKSLPFPSGGGMMGGSSQGIEMDLLRFYIDTKANGVNSVPDSLVSIPSLNAANAKRTRVFNLTPSGMMLHSINGLLWEIDRVDFSVPWGELEIWEYRNLSMQPHPMHMHAALFQILDRNGAQDIRPEDKGWKDTVLVDAGETVRILVKFDSHPGVFVHHCHNLEHEDSGMMQNFEVLPDPTPVVRISSTETVVSWPGPLVGWILESSDSPNPNSNWQPVNQQPSKINNEWTVTIPGVAERKFYRLVGSGF